MSTKPTKALVTWAAPDGQVNFSRVENGMPVLLDWLSRQFDLHAEGAQAVRRWLFGEQREIGDYYVVQDESGDDIATVVLL